MLHNSQMTFPNTKVVTRTGFELAAFSLPASRSTTWAKQVWELNDSLTNIILVNYWTQDLCFRLRPHLSGLLDKVALLTRLVCQTNVLNLFSICMRKKPFVGDATNWAIEVDMGRNNNYSFTSTSYSVLCHIFLDSNWQPPFACVNTTSAPKVNQKKLANVSLKVQLKFECSPAN
jgi:hypothetical protein